MKELIPKSVENHKDHNNEDLKSNYILEGDKRDRASKIFLRATCEKKPSKRPLLGKKNNPK